MIGHSTGCQNSVHFLKHGPSNLVEMIKAVALQAPCSDREGVMTESNYEKNIKYARSLKLSGQEMELMPRDAFWAPITAKRFLDLQDRGGADDFFSSDLSDEELVERLGHIGLLHKTLKHVLVAFSGSDEYVPNHIDSLALTERLVEAMNTKSGCVAKALYLPTANHNLSEGDGNIDIFVGEVSKLLHA